MTGRVACSRRGDVLVAQLGRDSDDENRLDRELLDGLDAALDAVAETRAAALVTVGSARFYSNGYDLDWLATLERAERRDFIRDTQRLLARLLVLGVPTVAALSGHAFGAGALLALAHDQRIACAEHGFFCLPEIDAKIPLRHGMTALVQARLSPRAARDAVLTGHRYPADEAVAAGIADAAVGRDGLLGAACALAEREVGPPPEALSARKRDRYGDVERLLAGAS